MDYNGFAFHWTWWGLGWYYNRDRDSGWDDATLDIVVGPLSIFFSKEYTNA